MLSFYSGFEKAFSINEVKWSDHDNSFKMLCIDWQCNWNYYEWTKIVGFFIQMHSAKFSLHWEKSELNSWKKTGIYMSKSCSKRIFLFLKVPLEGILFSIKQNVLPLITSLTAVWRLRLYEDVWLHIIKAGKGKWYHFHCSFHPFTHLLLVVCPFGSFWLAEVETCH